MIVAGAIALMLAGVVLLVAINNRTSRSSETNEVPIDISERPPTAGGDVVDISAQATGRFQAVDKDNPSRISWELLFSKLDPIAPGVYKVAQPRAWVYLRDGKVMYVRADAGQIKKPAGAEGQVESGTFTGNVETMIFARAAGAEGSPGGPASAPSATPATPGAAVDATAVAGSGAKVWDPEHDTPWLLAASEKIDFDTVLLELATDQPVRISTKELQFDGQSLLVRGNQVKNRIEFLNVGGPGTIRYAMSEDRSSGGGEKDRQAAARGSGAGVPGATGSAEVAAVGSHEAAATPSDPAASAANGAAASATNAPRAKPIKEDWYRTVFSDRVVLRQGTGNAARRLDADMLEVFAHTIDNKLPEGTMGAPSPPPERRAQGEGTVERLSELMRSDAQQTEQATRHDVAGRGQRNGAVVVPVTFPGQVASSPPSTAPTTTPPTATTPTVASAAAASAGSLRTLFEPKDADTVLEWSGTLTGSPLAKRPGELTDTNHLLARFSAAKTGGVRFTDAGTGAIGRSDTASYAATTRELALAGGPTLGQAWVYMPKSGQYQGKHVAIALGTGDVRMDEAGMISSRRVEESHAADPGPLPALAAGEVLPADEDRRISWGEKARFKFDTRKGSITSDLMRADFIGDVVARDRGSTLTVAQLDADFAPVGASGVRERRRTPNILAHGAGQFEHVQAPTVGAAAAQAREAGGAGEPKADHYAVTWTRSMSYDDVAGVLEANGDAVATASGPLVQDVLKSFRVRLDLAPIDKSSSHDKESDAVIGDRRVVRAEATGESEERDGGRNATIESRRYSPGAAGGERTLDQVMYLEGTKIIADEVQGQVRVPGSGRALFLDQRAEAPSAAARNPAGAGGGSAVTGDFRGTTRFDWRGSMVYTRASGVIDLSDMVEMVHKPLDNQPFIRLTCADLRSRVSTPPSSSPAGEARTSAQRAGRLESAEANGNVLIETGDGKKMVSQRATYDALRSLIEATSEGENVVTMFDEKEAAPLRAKRMRWDVLHDRIEIAEPAPASMPR